ncbi:MAG: P1 family peptidase [Longimicrobiales bacterium]
MTLSQVPGFRVGHAEVPGGGSGCTVILGPFRGAVEVRGLASGSREMGALSPDHLVEGMDAILLTGGSAFGLAAADGVMGWLEERGRGFDTGVATVPLVPAAVIFDLAPGRARPGAAEGRAACDAACEEPVPQGRVGAGAGATVGKVLGPGGASAGGLGSVSRLWRGHRVGALAVVNALGDVVGTGGEILAGARGADGGHLQTDSHLLEGRGPGEFAGAGSGEEENPETGPLLGSNTTLVVLGTDLPLSRVELGRLARMASGGFPRAISPVNTPFDGDVLFALSSGEHAGSLSPGEMLALGVVARTVTEEAIRQAVTAGSGDSKNGNSMTAEGKDG